MDLDVDADNNMINKRFKQMSLRLHPDKNRGSESEATRKYQAMVNARDFLLDSSIPRAADDDIFRDAFAFYADERICGTEFCVVLLKTLAFFGGQRPIPPQANHQAISNRLKEFQMRWQFRIVYDTMPDEPFCVRLGTEPLKTFTMTVFTCLVDGKEWSPSTIVDQKRHLRVSVNISSVVGAMQQALPTLNEDDDGSSRAARWAAVFKWLCKGDLYANTRIMTYSLVLYNTRIYFFRNQSLLEQVRAITY